MTAPVTTSTLAGPQATAVEPGEDCPACPHPMAAHDPIGTRFCRATVAGSVQRGCVCRVG
jgi:hypothetical protein